MSRPVEKTNVLVFPAGSEIGLEIFDSLKYSHHVTVFGASGKGDHGAFVYDPSRYIEDSGLYVHRADFIDRLNRYLHKYQIKYIYPTHDTVAYFLAANQNRVAAQVITSSADTNRVARDKTETYKVFRKFEFCPFVYSAGELDLNFPVYLKPSDGQGGQGAFRANDQDELRFYLRRSPHLLVMEFLPGEELSVDCFTDYKGELLFVGPRTRERVHMGISLRSTAVPLSAEVEEIARVINQTVALNGAWFFQVKRDINGKLKLLEFAPRQSSTMGLYRHAGVNFALLSYFNAKRIPVQILKNDYALQVDRRLSNRFKANLKFRRVYIDFDETVVNGDMVHGRVLDFIYQCRNEKIEMILITKHRRDLHETLKRHAIAENLFDRIVHLDESQSKVDFVEPADAIFIDNHWLDRHAVKQKHGIPVFDVDAVECLMR